MADRVRNISVTINNWTQEDYENVKSLDYNYLIIGKEGKDKTPHLQCYVQLERCRLSTIKKKIKRGHIEEAKNTPLFNRRYCMKEGDYEEFGEIKHQGMRSDLDQVRQLALDGGMRQVTTVCNASEITVAEKFLSHNETPRKWKPNIFWIYGPTGVGKSRLARHILQGTTNTTDPDIFVLHPVLSTDDPDPYTKSDPSKWWNGYDAHPNVIIDDFRPSWWTFTYLLSLLDRYECRVEIKGNVRQFKARNIVLTSLRSPEYYYSKRFKYTPSSDTTEPHEPHEQLLRRIDELIELNYHQEEDDFIEDMADFINRKLVKSKKKKAPISWKQSQGVIDFNKADEIFKSLSA